MAQSAKGKKLINSVEGCVQDNLEGFVALNPGIKLLKGHKVVIRADFEELQKNGKIAIVSGGGSGHEPAFSGYVGEGMLTAAVMGSVFASPPPSEILAALRAVTAHNKAGCLLLFNNYTGDRLNFGLAFERAREEGLRVAMHVTGEDCALTTSDKTAGRRGLIGLIATIKIAGALAEEGRSLEDVLQVVAAAHHKMATIGLALSPCTVPGSGPTFEIGDDEMELGLGAHGEAGVRRLKVTTAKEAVHIMLNHMTNPSNTNHLDIMEGNQIALFVNDLGGMSQLELNILSGETISYFESKNIRVVRAYCTAFLSSLEMAGFHITALLLNPILKRSLDAPTLAPAWPHHLLPKGISDRIKPQILDLDYISHSITEDFTGAVTLNAEEAQCLLAILKAACLSLVEEEYALNSLDTGSGDGDCGSTLARGARAVLKELSSKSDANDLLLSKPYLLARRLAAIAEENMGGASGGLYSLFFTGVAASFKDYSADGHIWAEALKQGMDRMMRYGGAEPGDRTMLDALYPALNVLAAASSNDPQEKVFENAVMAAERGADSTNNLKARAGRASYVSESFLQYPDPGAVGVAIWLRAAYRAFAGCRKVEVI